MFFFRFFSSCFQVIHHHMFLPASSSEPLLLWGADSCTHLGLLCTVGTLGWSDAGIQSLQLVSLLLSFLVCMPPFQATLLTQILPSPSVLSVITLDSSSWSGQPQGIHEATWYGMNIGQKMSKFWLFYVLTIWSLTSYLFLAFLLWRNKIVILPHRIYEN